MPIVVILVSYLFLTETEIEGPDYSLRSTGRGQSWRRLQPRLPVYCERPDLVLYPELPSCTYYRGGE